MRCVADFARRRPFDEELFKATNPAYCKLGDAGACEQQHALLEMVRVVSNGEYLRHFVHGGPGTGKSFLMSLLEERSLSG